MKNTVTVALYGGLGNQLFQYATALAVARHHQAELVLDVSWFDLVHNLPNTTVRKYALPPLGIAQRTVSKPTPEHTPLRHLMTRAARKLRRHLGFSTAGTPTFNESGFRFDQAIFDAAPPLFLNGYWQSPRYFDAIQNELRELLGTPRTMSPASTALHHQIRNSDAICLHVRRGDYVTNQHAASTHGLCDLGYYHAGIATVKQGLAAPHAFLFSDDPQWVRENLKLDIPMTVVDANGPDDAHQDLWLMAACKRFVIANSSLSWWGAWLSDDEAKTVVAPRIWFADQKLDTTDLIPAQWVRL